MKVGAKYIDISRAYESGVRIIANKGGTRSTKTWCVLIFLRKLAINAEQPTLISVVSESVPHLRKGALRDFENILNICNEVEGVNYQRNRTENSFTFGNGKIEFFSADSYTKVHGAQRDILFINECNNLEYEIFRQLAIRTSDTIFLDWNPRSRFWFEEHLEGREDCTLIHSTYKDNPFLTPMHIAEIESNQSDSNWWRVYGLGETGSVEGLVYTNWQISQTYPTEYKREFICIDFGFTNDPTAILRVRLSGGELWVDEIAYRTGMLNQDIVKELKDAGVARGAQIVCDSAEQKSIAEINNLGGFRAVPVSKGKGSIVSGITAVQAYKLNVTQRSLGTIDELRNYSWRRDINGNYINEPIDRYNHSLDALRYGVTTFLMAQRSYSTPRPHIGHIC
jgi:phage terminase large subunit